MTKRDAPRPRPAAEAGKNIIIISMTNCLFTLQIYFDVSVHQIAAPDHQAPAAVEALDRVLRLVRPPAVREVHRRVHETEEESVVVVGVHTKPKDMPPKKRKEKGTRSVIGNAKRNVKENEKRKENIEKEIGNVIENATRREKERRNENANGTRKSPIRFLKNQSQNHVQGWLI